MPPPHRLLGVLIGVIQIRGIGPHRQHGGNYQHPGGLEKAGHRVRTVMLYAIGNNHCTNHEQEIVGHLHMVRHNLQGSEEGCQRTSQQVLAPVGQYHTGYRGRYIGQGDKFPDVTGRNDYKEIGRKGIGYRTEGSQIPTHIQGEQEDIETQHHDKDQRYRRNQPQVVNALQPL